MQNRWLLLLLLAAACQHAEPVSFPANVTPSASAIEPFTRFSRFVSAKLSPHGTYVAAISTEHGKRALSIIDVKNRKVASTFRADPESVGNVYWANDSRVVIELWSEGDGSLAQPTNYGELYAINADTGRGEMMFGYRAVSSAPGPVGSTPAAEQMGGEFLARLRGGDDRHVLVNTYYFRDAGDRTTSLISVDVYNGRRNQLTVAPIPNSGFITDERGEPRIAYGETENVEPRYFYRDPDGPWTEFTRSIPKNSRPMEFEAQAGKLILYEPLQKGFGVFALDVATGERTLLSKNDWVPPTRFLEDRQQRILAIQYDPDLPTWDFIVPDHPLSRVLKGLLAAYPDDNVQIFNVTDDEKKAMVFVYSDRDPGQYLMVDVDKLTAEEIVSRRPWVKSQDMAEMTAFHIKASDGRWIHGYVTLPKNAKAGVPSPMVVLPHGGPHGIRDDWGYDSEVQLLASQGFAVLQVNFRGSGGYGREFREAGYEKWGDRMIQDIVDATRYAVSKGYADPKRICSYGASYGAFAALQSAVLAPDLFRCAVGYSGIYDLPLMADKGDIPETRQGIGFLKRAVGTDEAELRRQSPVYNAGKIKAKVLLIHGRQDERAPIAHAERLKEALEKAGNPPKWIVESHEGHGFFDEGARARMYTALVAFLKENTN